MTNRSKAKGTAWNTAITNYLIELGWIHAENRSLKGRFDRGDIAGVPGVVIEAKNAKTHELAEWLDEAEVERTNDHADMGVVWFKRRGKTSPAKGYVLMDGETFVCLLKQAGYGP